MSARRDLGADLGAARRVLPAVLASALVIGLSFTGVSFAMDRWNEGETIARRPMTAEGDPMVFDTSVLTVAYGIETRDGEFLTYEEFFGRGLDFQMNDEQGRMYTSQEDFEEGRFFGYETQLVIPRLTVWRDHGARGTRRRDARVSGTRRYSARPSPAAAGLMAIDRGGSLPAAAAICRVLA